MAYDGLDGRMTIRLIVLCLSCLRGHDERRDGSEGSSTYKRVYWVDVCEVLKEIFIGFIRVGDIERNDGGAGGVTNVASQNAHTCINL